MSLALAQRALRAGSRSFHWASRLFPREVAQDAARVYAWCRHCDDAIDDAKDPKAAAEALARARRMTHSAFEGERSAEGGDAWIFAEFGRVARARGLPRAYAFDLLDGMEMDLHGRRYATFEELRLYCFRAAGTVGLLMTHVMGVGKDSALRHAMELGIAMQLTNIARDVLEDAGRGRIYLPLEWLKEEGVPASPESFDGHREGLARVVRRLLDAAEISYREGMLGTRYLPWRSALAVEAAARIYREIGRKVMRRGQRAWDSRTVVPGPSKAWLGLRSLAATLVEVPPWSDLRKPNPIQNIWRHS